MAEPAPFPQRDDNANPKPKRSRWATIGLIVVIALILAVFIALHLTGIAPHQ